MISSQTILPESASILERRFSNIDVQLATRIIKINTYPATLLRPQIQSKRRYRVLNKKRQNKVNQPLRN
jgi:hypothetical protein